ncbi:hypothetical protein [Streptomyces sp. NPDC058674]|uniref:hypothetical protein n=1 Tax=Streptomyces sp. NPDC058674 TaxID=3346592 RepID=UPI00364B76AC
MPEQRDALTELVRQYVGTGRRWSTRTFVSVAVDPDTGWAPSKSLLAKIIAGQGYTITPQLVSALAAGFDLPREVVAAAAHFQTIGYESRELAGSTAAKLLRRLDADDQSLAAGVAERWAAESDD